MSVTINRRLNLVIPLDRGDGSKLYIHSTPIRPETFDFYHMVLAKTFSAFAHNGLDPMSGPSVAAMILRDVAKTTMRSPGVNWFDGDDGIGGNAGLMAEIRRLSSVITYDGDKGWATVPLQIALDKGMILDDEKDEVVNILAFFTVASLVAPRLDRPRLVNGMARIYELDTTHLNSTEYANSLKILMQEELSGRKNQASSPELSSGVQEKDGT